jgi:hypothetical protein
MHEAPFGAAVMGIVRAVPINDETCAGVSSEHAWFAGGVCMSAATTTSAGVKAVMYRSFDGIFVTFMGQ